MREAETPLSYRMLLVASVVAAFLGTAAMILAPLVTRPTGTGIARFAARSRQSARP
jgi:hypothetical protein